MKILPISLLLILLQISFSSTRNIDKRQVFKMDEIEFQDTFGSDVARNESPEVINVESEVPSFTSEVSNMRAGSTFKRNRLLRRKGRRSLTVPPGRPIRLVPNRRSKKGPRNLRGSSFSGFTDAQNTNTRPGTSSTQTTVLQSTSDGQGNQNSGAVSLSPFPTNAVTELPSTEKATLKAGEETVKKKSGGRSFPPTGQSRQAGVVSTRLSLATFPPAAKVTRNTKTTVDNIDGTTAKNQTINKELLKNMSNKAMIANSPMGTEEEVEEESTDSSVAKTNIIMGVAISGIAIVIFVVVMMTVMLMQKKEKSRTKGSIKKIAQKEREQKRRIPRMKSVREVRDNIFSSFRKVRKPRPRPRPQR